MPFRSVRLTFLCIILTLSIFASININAIKRKPKSVLTVLLARNKQHTLPYFLTLFSKLNYPKDRLSLFIRSDHNFDKTTNVIKDWLAGSQHKYHSVDVSLNDGSPTSYPYEGSPTNWTDERFDHVISLKEEAISKARRMWADYIWFLDVDVFITDPDILHHLIEEDKSIVAPMLKSLGTYSNYWCGMTKNYWYERTEDYLPILEKKKKGCFAVPMVHSCVLINLSYVTSDYLSFNPQKIQGYDGPKDDIIAFAVGANRLGLEMHVCNNQNYGFIPSPLNADDKLSKDYQLLTDIKLEILVDFPPLPVANELIKYAVSKPRKSKIVFDNVYLINLVRRPDRRERMMWTFDELGIEVEIFDAVDGQKINSSYLELLGVKQLTDYKDPWAKRDMTYGEIGCFLSHYHIWEDIVMKEYHQAIIFEDDIRFEPFFLDKLKYMLKQASRLSLSWDLIYLGRKKLKDSDEPWVEGSDILVHVDYSYWTLCYIITLQGAKKLLRPSPLGKLVPVDEYIPIMFDKHPEIEWKEKFEPRNLKAYSVAPLMVYPTHYTGEEGYISDTEESQIIDDKLRDGEKHSLPMGPPTFQLKDIDMDLGINEMKDEL